MTDQIRKEIEGDVKSNAVMLFMKGTPEEPQCGFSAQIVSTLHNLGVGFASKDVLINPSLRQGIKEYANWPTIPQLYIKGEFVGGCDVVDQLSETGELKKLLGLQ